MRTFIALLALLAASSTASAQDDKGIPLNELSLYSVRVKFEKGGCTTPKGYSPSHYVCTAPYAIPVTPGKELKVYGGFVSKTEGAGAIATVMTVMELGPTGVTVGLTRDWMRDFNPPKEANWMDAAFSYEVELIVVAEVK
mgnify:CR=1 FL=1